MLNFFSLTWRLARRLGMYPLSACRVGKWLVKWATVEDTHCQPEVPPPDSHHLNAVYGWMELGNSEDALAELERIVPEYQSHPEVLLARFRLFSRARRLDGCMQIGATLIELAPDWSESWLAYCSALHWLTKTSEAYEVIKPQLRKFPQNWMIHYDLACYACQMGNLQESKEWLEKACDLGNRRQIQRMALKDPDLRPMQKEE